MHFKRSTFRGFGHREIESEESPKIMKGEFVKGLGPSIKEDTWQVGKVSGEDLKDFKPSL
jgi:hypothetical protein